MCKICIIAAVWLLEKKNIFLQRVHSFREEKGANLLVLSEKWLSRIQSFFLVLVVSFTERILQNLMKEFYILDLYVEVRFFCRSPMEYLYIWAGAAVCLKLILSPKSDFYCKNNIKRKNNTLNLKCLCSTQK